jgi:ribonucleotide reductase beta subunit family protein with ferritin-like domain
LTALLANILLAEEMGVRSFRSILNALPESLTKTHAAIESILQDELRHVQYLSDALQTLQASFLIEQYRQDIENKVFQDFGKVFEFLSKPSEERPVLVKAGVQPELTLI